MSSGTPRVDACIEAVSKRFPSLKSTAYFEEVHQHITPLARNMERELDSLRTAVEAFIKAKGRYHTEQGYKALVEAFDATKEVKTTL